jgi:hypothetical protein
VKKIKKFLDSNEYEYMTYQNLWDTAKAVLRGKFVPICSYIKNTEASQMSNCMMHLKLIENQEKVKPRTNRWKKITKIKTNMIKIETKK